MVVVGLVVVAVVSIIVARVGLAYSDGARSGRRSTAGTPDPTIDLSDAGDGSGGPSVREWTVRGFDQDTAAGWIDHGFDPDHAFLFRSLEIDAPTAARLRGAGLEDSALVTLVEEASFTHHNGHAQLVALAEQAPHLAPQALAWIRLGASTDQALAFAREGFTPAASDTWRAAGWHLDDALPWFAARFEPTPALTWRDNGFEPAEADAWRREHFGVRQAIEWRRLGDTPARARLVERQFADARVTVTEGLQWLDLGFSVEEICAGWPKMATGQDARSWRAGWNGIGLTPAEVSAWHTKFDHDETRRWLDAGVRDASSAATLRARGFGPEDMVDAVPVTRDDLLSAAGQIARAGGAPEIGHRLQRAAEAPRDVGMDVIEDVVDELQRLGDEGRLGAPTTARALARRFERGLLAAALRSDRTARMDTAQAT